MNRDTLTRDTYLDHLTGSNNYNNFTGHTSSNSAIYNNIIMGCPDDNINKWGTLRWEANIPDDSMLQIRFRVAQTESDLENAIWLPNDYVEYFTLEDIPININDFIHLENLQQNLNYLEIEFLFTLSTTGISPYLYSYSIARECSNLYGDNSNTSTSDGGSSSTTGTSDGTTLTSTGTSTGTTPVCGKQ